MSVSIKDSLPQPRENSFDLRDIKAMSRSSGCAEAREMSPPIPTERLAVCSCTGAARRSLCIWYTENDGEVGEIQRPLSIGSGPADENLWRPYGTRVNFFGYPALPRWAKLSRPCGGWICSKLGLGLPCQFISRTLERTTTPNVRQLLNRRPGFAPGARKFHRARRLCGSPHLYE